MEIEQTSDASSKKLQQQKKVTKEKSNVKKLDIETNKLLFQLKEKVNKKPFGRKIRDSEIIALSIRKIGPDDIKLLQESTFTERDIIAIAHEKYVKEKGRISLNEYLGKLVRGEIQVTQNNKLDHGA